MSVGFLSTSGLIMHKKSSWGLCKNLYTPIKWEVRNLKHTNRTITLLNAVFRDLKAPIAPSLMVLAHQDGTGSYAWPVVSQ